MPTNTKTINGVRYIKRKGYTRSDGVRVKPTWIKDRGKPGKGKRRISIKAPGSLKKYGYSLKKSAMSRRRSLDKAVKKYGDTKTFRKVNALSVFFKDTDPSYAKKATADKNYIRRKFMS